MAEIKGLGGSEKLVAAVKIRLAEVATGSKQEKVWEEISIRATSELQRRRQSLQQRVDESELLLQRQAARVAINALRRPGSKKGTGRTRAATVLYPYLCDPKIAKQFGPKTELTKGELSVINRHIGGLLQILKVKERLPLSGLLEKVEELPRIVFGPGTYTDHENYIGLCNRRILEMRDFGPVSMMFYQTEQPTFSFTRKGVEIVKGLIRAGRIDNHLARPAKS